MRDVVCKMELDERPVKESLVYREKNYYFCSVGCRAEFERHPEGYAQAAPTEQGEKNNV